MLQTGFPAKSKRYLICCCYQRLGSVCWERGAWQPFFNAGSSAMQGAGLSLFKELTLEKQSRKLPSVCQEFRCVCLKIPIPLPKNHVAESRVILVDKPWDWRGD